jgi:hypothetical protein
MPVFMRILNKRKGKSPDYSIGMVIIDKLVNTNQIDSSTFAKSYPAVQRECAKF